MSIFITGTDTAVGKTRVATALVRGLRAAGRDAVGFKPVCCGERGDSEALAAAAGGTVDVNAVNPVWLHPPLAPYAAAMVEGRVVDVAMMREGFARLRAAHESVVVEGAGGWLVPLTRDFMVADLAVEFALPVLVVAANRLGVINHTLLTVAAVLQRGLECRGVILNDVRERMPDDMAAVTNRAMLEELLPVPVLGEMGFGDVELPEETRRALIA